MYSEPVLWLNGSLKWKAHWSTRIQTKVSPHLKCKLFFLSDFKCSHVCNKPQKGILYLRYYKIVFNKSFIFSSTLSDAEWGSLQSDIGSNGLKCIKGFSSYTFGFNTSNWKHFLLQIIIGKFRMQSALHPRKPRRKNEHVMHAFFFFFFKLIYNGVHLKLINIFHLIIN